VSGLGNKLRAAAASVTPSLMLAEQHRKTADPAPAGVEPVKASIFGPYPNVHAWRARALSLRAGQMPKTVG
jgi:hypothetical protein